MGLGPQYQDPILLNLFYINYEEIGTNLVKKMIIYAEWSILLCVLINQY